MTNFESITVLKFVPRLLKNQFPILLMMLLLGLVSCGEGEQVNPAFESKIIIPQDTLILVLKDLHIVDAAAKQNLILNNAINVYKYQEYKAVLEKYELSKARFDSTINLYTQHGKQLDELYEKVIETLVQEEQMFDPSQREPLPESSKPHSGSSKFFKHPRKE